MAGTVLTLWRCAECGKWSHAKRRPRAHERYVRNLDPATALPDDRDRHDAAEQASYWALPVVEVTEATSGTTYDMGDPVNGDMGGPLDDWVNLGGVTIRCGPFEEWEATRLVPWTLDPVAKEHARRLSAESVL